MQKIYLNVLTNLLIISLLIAILVYSIKDDENETSSNNFKIGSLSTSFVEKLQNNNAPNKLVETFGEIPSDYNNYYSWAESPGGGVKNQQNRDIEGPIWNQQQCGDCWLISAIQMVLSVGVMNDTTKTPQTTDLRYIFEATSIGLSSCVCLGSHHLMAIWAINQYGLMPAQDNKTNTNEIFVEGFSVLSNTCNFLNSIDPSQTIPTGGINIIGTSPANITADQVHVAMQTNDDSTNIFNSLNTNFLVEYDDDNITNEFLQKILYYRGPVTVSVCGSVYWNTPINTWPKPLPKNYTYTWPNPGEK